MTLQPAAFTSTTGAQLRAAFDASNFADLTVDSAGILTIAPTGTLVKVKTGANFQVEDNVGIGQAPGTRALEVTEASSGTQVAFLTQSHASNPLGLFIDYSASAPNGTANVFLRALDSGATRAEIRSNGGLANFQSNDADLSDSRMKEMYGVIDGERAFSAIMSLDIETGRYLDNLKSRKMVMITAQNAAECEDGWCAHDGWKLADELDEDGEVVKEGETRHATNNKDIYLSHIRATQHLAGIIEALNDRVTTLEGPAA